MSDEALSMEEPKRKLAKLEELIPDVPEQVGEFGRFLADYLNPQLRPMGFLMGCQLAISDLQSGVSNRKSAKIPSSLIGHQPAVYALLSMYIVPIAEAVFPADFAASVKTYDEASARRR